MSDREFKEKADELAGFVSYIAYEQVEDIEEENSVVISGDDIREIRVSLKEYYDASAEAEPEQTQIKSDRHELEALAAELRSRATTPETFTDQQREAYEWAELALRRALSNRIEGTIGENS